MIGFNSQDLYSASYKNQFSFSGITELNEEGKVYFITNVRGTNWTLNVVNNGLAYTRTGASDTQFFHPITAERLKLTNVTEISGFFIEMRGR